MKVQKVKRHPWITVLQLTLPLFNALFKATPDFVYCCIYFCISLSPTACTITVNRWGLRRDRLPTLVDRSSKGRLRVLANPNVSPGKSSSGKDVIMVDPLEAKRLAAKEMEEIKATEKLKRRRRIEAINGAWAMIGLTAGLVIEGQTGNSILAQLAGYWADIVHIFVR